MVTSRTHLKERAITAKPVTRGDASLTTIISEFCGDPLCIPRQFGLTVLTCPWLVTCGSVRSGSTGGGGDFGSYSFRVGYASWESGGVPMILSRGFEEVLGVSCVVAFGLGYVGLLVGEHVE